MLLSQHFDILSKDPILTFGLDQVSRGMSQRGSCGRTARDAVLIRPRRQPTEAQKAKAADLAKPPERDNAPKCFYIKAQTNFQDPANPPQPPAGPGTEGYCISDAPTPPQARHRRPTR